MMTFQPLRSTAIVSAGYDPETRTLEVEFVNGRSYTHEDVDPQVYEALLASPSPGRYYADNIKGVY